MVIEKEELLSEVPLWIVLSATVNRLGDADIVQHIHETMISLEYFVPPLHVTLVRISKQ